VDKKVPKKIKRCPTCGTIINDSQRVDRMLMDADEALERFANKLRSKKHGNVGKCSK
tara:strand:+ start:204 stop:374 length:171 start_codon:yes stop_codon:yes gene_type:complete